MSETIYRVLIADRLSEAGLAPLRADGRFELVERSNLTPAELADALAGVDGVIVRSMTHITRESLAHATRLRVIGRAGVGVDNIDVEAATERGIAVINTPSANTISAAELTLALLLALVRRVPAAAASMRSGDWDRSSFQGTELHGKTLGLVGAGRIGGEVAKRARAFGMKVVAYDPFLSEERARAMEIEAVGLEDVLRRADVLSLHVPLTDGTAGLIGRRELELLPEGAFVVNAARGGVLDETALLDALRSGRVAGAALDVFEDEPLPADHPLRTLPNTVLTPHLGAATREAQQNVAAEVGEAVRDALAEGDLTRAVNAPAVGGEQMRRMRPLLELAERLGQLAAALPSGPIEEVEVRYAGSEQDALRPLTASAMAGVLTGILGRGAANFVNAMHLAESRGMRLQQVRSDSDADYTEYLEVRTNGPGGMVLVGGALLAQGHPRVTRIGDFTVNVVPRGALVVIRNRDVPGVIGRVGTLLGNAGINIAEYHQARRAVGGEALAAISVDGRLDPALVESLRRIPEVQEVRQVQLS